MRSVLVARGRDTFVLANTYDGEIASVDRQAVWSFVRTNGRITGFELRAVPSDDLLWTGTKQP